MSTPYRLFATRSLRAAAAATALAAALAPPPPVARADDLGSFSLRQHLDLRGGVASGAPTALAPAPRAAGYRESGARATWLHAARYESGRLRFDYQGRLAFGRHAGRDPTAAPIGETPPLRYWVDEAALRWSPDDAWTVHVGRRNLVFGRAVGINPVDVLARPLEQDPSLDALRARGEQRGFDMVGLEWRGDAGALQAHHLPRIPGLGRDEPAQTIAAWSGLAFDGGLDYALYARHRAAGGGRPDLFGVGASLSAAIGEATIGYVDLRVDDGRGRVVPRPPSGRPTPSAERGRTLYPVFTLGISHDFAPGVTLDLEYTHDSTGYSASEWRGIAAAIAASSPPRSAEQARGLGAIAGALGARTLRRDYVFARLAVADPALPGLAVEATALVGLGDFSGVIGLGVTRELSETLTASIRATGRFGGSGDEFALRPDRRALTLSLTARF